MRVQLPLLLAAGLSSAVCADTTILFQRTNDQVLLHWQGQSGYTYRVVAVNQISQSWMTQLTNLTVFNNPRSLLYVDPTAISSQGSRFYRIGELKCSPPISIVGQTNATISNLYITNATGHGITIINSQNIRVLNCLIGPCQGEAIHIEASAVVNVTGNRFESVASGIYALNSQQVQVTCNGCLNVKGPFPRGQLAQFDKVSGPGNCVNSNLCQNVLGRSNPEDAISVFQSNGTPDSPIQVVGNQIRGGGPSGSGGGIMTGDGGGSYILVQDNILVDPGQYGIAIAGGDHIQIISNRVYGKQQAFTNVGLYVWNQYTPPCNSHTVSGNQVRWFNSSGVENPCWNGSNCGSIAGWDDNDWHANLDEMLLPDILL